MPYPVFVYGQGLDGHFNLNALNLFLDSFDLGFCRDMFGPPRDRQLDHGQPMRLAHGANDGQRPTF